MAAGTKKNSPVSRALGRNQSGFTTKPHLSCNAYNQICALDLTGSQGGGTCKPLGCCTATCGRGQPQTADQAYDADHVRGQIEQAEAGAVVPSKKTGRYLPNTMPKCVKNEAGLDAPSTAWNAFKPWRPAA